MIKFLVILLSALVAVALGLYLFSHSLPPLPGGTDAVVKKVLASEPPTLVKGKTSVADHGKVDIWYEVISNTSAPKATVLLIMGNGATALSWPRHFFQPLVDFGYEVIRFDNRGVGLSNWMMNWTKDNAYSLEDMTNDAIAILNELGIEKAHIIGVSMGGMIAQHLAIDHPDRVLSLSSIMSSGHLSDPSLPRVSKKVTYGMYKLILKYGLVNNEQNSIKFAIAFSQLTQGDGNYELNLEAIAHQVQYELRERRGYNPKAIPQHDLAMDISGSRYGDLSNIQAPTLVIHGLSDPVILWKHSQKYAAMIPGANTLWIEGMGHDLPAVYMQGMLEHILANFERAVVDD